MAKDWLKDYGTKTPQKFQTGGPMAAPAPAPEGGMPPEGAPAGPEGGAPNLDAMLAEYAQTRDPQLAVAICDMLVEMVASQGGQGGPAPEGGAPMAKKGAKMSKAPVFKAKKKC